MKFFLFKFIILNFATIFTQICSNQVNDNCITFLIDEGTTCQQMCIYCASMLNSSTYYFLPPVCSNQLAGCIGDPQGGVSYSCCNTY